MKKVFLLLIMFFALRGYGQTVSQYVLTRNNSGTPSTITGGPGTVVTTGFSDDDLTQTGIPIGFSFVYCGTTYTTLSACSNGWVSLANSSSNILTNSAGNVPSAGFLMPFWDDLDGFGPNGYYQTSGTAPNRVFTIQWGQPSPAAQRWANFTGTGRACWQVRLFESSNVVEFAYLFSNYSGNSATVGIANSSSDYQTLPTTASLTANSSTFTTGLATIPAANGILDWTPPPVMSVSPSSLTFTTGASTNSAAQTVSLTAYGLTAGATVTAPTNFQVFNPGTTTWVSSFTIANSTAALGTYINTTVQVRFVGPAAVGTYTGNLTFTSTGATTRTVSLTGNVAAACSGTPSAGTLASTVTSGSCSPYTTVLSLSGTTVAANIAYQWQSSTNNATWTDVAGATNPTYSPTISSSIYYHAVVTCSNSGLSASTTGTLHSYTSCLIMPGSGTTSVTTCGSLFYDSGGPLGVYSDNETGTYTIYPGAGSSGSKVSVTFSSFTLETCCDNLKIYNGNSIAAPLIGTYTTTPPTITSTAVDGSLTFKFTSDVSITYAGWAATITNTNPNPITTQPAATTNACQGISSTISLTAAGTNSYQWYNNGSTNSNSGGTLIAGATNSSYSPSTASTGTTYYYATVANACGISFISNVAAVIVNPQPATIGGTASVCSTLTTTLTNTTTGGTWSSSSSGVASVGFSTGVVTGGTAGNATITYTITTSGCYVTRAVTVNALPAVITGTASACVNASTILSDATPSGTWTSGTPGIASVGSSSGVVNGILAGLSIITYTAPNGCRRTVEVTINPLPVTTITPSSAVTICMGESVAFTANAPAPSFNILLQDFNSGLGTWSLSNTSGNAASYWQITSSPASGATGDGTAMLEANSDIAYMSGFQVTTMLISPSFSTAGYGSANVSFNQYLLSLTSDANVDVDYSINGGGTWISLLNQVGVGSSLPGGGTGSWSSTTPEVTIALPPGAIGQSNVKLRWHYNAYAGMQWDIDNIKVTAFQPAATYVWTGISGATGLSCTACGTTTITPTATGANVYSVTSTTSASCQSITGVTVSVNPMPADIAGAFVVCENSTTTLTNGTSGGSWSSGSADISIGASSGVVTGINAATATVTYTLPEGCMKTAVVTVNPLPAAISGTMQVCEGLTTTLSSTPGGTWTSVVSAVASIGSSDGIVGGVAAGTTDVTYTFTATGCAVWGNVTVNHTPAAINGVSQICEAAGTTLTNVDAGGTWSSSAPSIATIGSADGILSAIADGTTTITYRLPEGCTSTKIVTVNPLPAAITGVVQVCEGLTTTLSSTTSGGAWSSAVPAVASIGSSDGIVDGIAAGTSDITYTFTATGCAVSAIVTVNHTPAAIVGVSQICEAAITTFTNVDAGGLWSSSAPGVAAIGSSDGILSAIADGTTTITYQLPEGCTSAMVVTVNPLPDAITGIMQVCEGLTTALSSATPGGTWNSVIPTVATINSTTGEVTGVAFGTTTIEYILTGTGCTVSDVVTVNHTPAAITGLMEVCEGLQNTLSNIDAGGTWASSTMSVATIDGTTGVVSAVLAGTTSITYQLPEGCTSMATVTVNALPAVIGGNLQVCEGLTTSLSDATIGGTWSGSSVNASVDGSGVVTGNTAGVETITYQLPNTCLRTADVTVNPTPAAINGILEVCEGLTTALSNPDAGGTWSSGATGTATVDVNTGVVTGGTAGVATVTYKLPTTCINTVDVTVNPLPAAIGGPSQVCEGLTITLTNTSTGGTWSSTAFGIAVIDGGGVLLGMGAGVTTITYTLPTGCIMTKDITVNALPAAITGGLQVCEGLTTTLSNGTAGGAWSSGTTAVANIDASSGVVSAIDAGTTIITYTLPTTCISTAEVTVNPLPAAIGGTRVVCEGLTTTLNDADPGGTWNSSAIAIAPIDASGVVTGSSAGTAFITYTLPTGCITSSVVTVNPLPAVINGVMQVCAGLTTSLSSVTPLGTWGSGATSVADVNATTGVVTAFTAGVTPVTYTLPTGCIRTAQVTVNPLPAAIGGTPNVCLGATTTLTDADAGGTWTSSAAGIAPINSTTGVVNGTVMGSATITYTLPTGCRITTAFTVNPLPAPITGPSQLCASGSSPFGNGSPAGTWTSSTPLVAIIDNVTGVATANAAGTTLITYTLPTGCLRTRTITINPLPSAISGTMAICQSATTTLANGTPGGTWVSLDLGVATVNTLGVVTGVATGTSTIIYRLSTGCITSAIVTVNAVPNLIASGTVMCQGQSVTLTSTMPGGSWSSSAAGVASVGAGVVTGVGAGSANISYSMPTGCSRSIPVLVNPTPAPIVGAIQLCQGATTAMTTATSGGVWTSSTTSVASINLASGVVTGLAAGTTTISYTMTTGGCLVMHTITVDAMPGAFSGSPIVCAGQTTTLSSSTTGGTWTSSNAAVATVGTSGTVAGVAAGNAVITYSLPSGCMRSTIVTVNGLPTAYNMTGGGTYCTGGSGVHIGLDNSNGSVSYQLFSGATAIGGGVAGITGMPLDFGTVAPAGTYSVLATAASTGCKNSMSGTSTITIAAPIPTLVNFSTSTGSDTMCSGIPITFTAAAINGGATPTYQWKVNGMVATGATSGTYNYTPANGDVVTVNMSSSVACATPAVAIASRTLIVKTSMMPVAGIAVAPGTILCQGNVATFSASALYGGSSPVFVWMKNGSYAATGPTYTYAPGNGDNVYVKLAGNRACALADTVLSGNLVMTVTPVYTPLVNITATPGNVIQLGTFVTLTANVTNAGPAPEFQWYIGSMAIAGATSSTLGYNTFANGDSVSCQVKGTGSCSTNGFSSLIMHVGGVGIDPVAEMMDVRLMPNPNKGEFAVKGTLSATADHEVAMEVTNMLGQVVYKTSVLVQNGTVDAKIRLDNTLANGMYILTMISGNDRKVFHFVLEQ